MTDLRLPALYEGVLDDEALAALSVDLRLVARVLEVRMKTSAHTPGIAAPTSTEAIDALVRGDATAVQVRWVHGGRAVLDTLMRRPSGGYRLVRMPLAGEQEQRP